MEKPFKRRAPHGVTSLMVLNALIDLHTQSGDLVKVSRAELLKAVPLPATTVDDRLRTLLKEKRVSREGRALYLPTPWPGFALIRLEAPGKRKIVKWADGLECVMEWRRSPWR